MNFKIKEVIILICITGDTHGNLERLYDKSLKRLKSNDYLIICGDFGFIWDDNKKTQKTIKKLSKLKFNILFVDGTHENFDLLEKYDIVPFANSDARLISDNIFHLLRGKVYNIENKNIFTFGGGESIDKEIRISQNKWWVQELPTIDEFKSAVVELQKFDRQVDYIVSHEPPGKIKTLIDKSSNINTLNRFFDDVAKEVKFKKWFFGSTHVNKEFVNKYVSLFDRIYKLD